MYDDDLGKVVQDRDGWTWTVDGEVATYRTEWWSATVRRAAIPPRRSLRWAVSVIHPDGNAAYFDWAGTAAEAVRVAEHRVRGLGPP